jgi:hypothetical protein
MSGLLKVRIEVPADKYPGLTPEELDHIVFSLFEIDGPKQEGGQIQVELRQAHAMDGMVTATILIALITVSVELIKFGFELRHRDQELEIRRRELAIQEEQMKIEQHRSRQPADESALLKKFVTDILLPALEIQKGIKPSSVDVTLQG